MFVESAAVHLHCAVGLEMVLRRPNDKGLNADGTAEGLIAQPLAHLEERGAGILSMIYKKHLIRNIF